MSTKFNGNRFLSTLEEVATISKSRIRRILLIGATVNDPCFDILNLFVAASLTAINTDYDYLRPIAQSPYLRSHLDSRRLRLLVQDAGLMTTFPYEGFNLILIRHPDLERQLASWERVLKSCGRLITTTGFLVISTYAISEARLIEKSLLGTGWVVLPWIITSAAGDVALTGSDRYIQVYEQIGSK